MEERWKQLNLVQFMPALFHKCGAHFHRIKDKGLFIIIDAMNNPSPLSFNLTDSTVVDCQKQVRSWRLLRSLAHLLIPTCNCALMEDQKPNTSLRDYHRPNLCSSTVTGTIFGSRQGKVSFCIQSNSTSDKPIVLLELAVPTTVLAREMSGGVLRLALECIVPKSGSISDCSLLSMPLWTVFCNGRKVGYAIKRRPSKADLETLSVMGGVVSGAGIVNKGDGGEEEEELIYLRAEFERIHGSSNSESFHLIDPHGCIGQELSIFFFRSK